MPALTVAEIVKDALGKKGVELLDSVVLDYIVAVLEDPDSHYGTDGGDMYDVVAPFLLDTGVTATEDDAMRVCKKLVSQLTEHGFNKEPVADTVKQLAAPVRIAAMGGAKTTGLELMRRVGEEELRSDDEGDGGDKKEGRARTREERLARRQANQTGGAGTVIEARAMNVEAQPVKVHAKGNQAASKNIRIDNLTVAFGGNVLLQDCSLNITFGRRYGIVGRNGVGKSTLMRAVANREVAVPKHLQVLYIEQEVAGNDMSALECVLSCDTERAALLAEEKKLLEQAPPAAAAAAKGGPASTAGASESSAGTGSTVKKGPSEEDKLTARLHEIYERLQEISADTAESRASSILAGLQFTAEMQAKKSKDFSGGWRMRIALARALFCEPDVLLLDEPTNHLDLHAVLWLENYLSRWKNTLIVVSHARDFLNAITTDIVHVFDKKLTSYNGNYDQFEKTRSERLLMLQRQADAQDMRRKHIQKFIDRFRYNAKRASMAQSRIKLLQKMQDISVPEDEGVPLRVPAAGAAPLLALLRPGHRHVLRVLPRQAAVQGPQLQRVDGLAHRPRRAQRRRQEYAAEHHRGEAEAAGGARRDLRQAPLRPLHPALDGQPGREADAAGAAHGPLPRRQPPAAAEPPGLDGHVRRARHAPHVYPLGGAEIAGGLRGAHVDQAPHPPPRRADEPPGHRHDRRADRGPQRLRGRRPPRLPRPAPHHGAVRRDVGVRAQPVQALPRRLRAVQGPRHGQAPRQEVAIGA